MGVFGEPETVPGTGIEIRRGEGSAGDLQKLTSQFDEQRQKRLGDMIQAAEKLDPGGELDRDARRPENELEREFGGEVLGALKGAWADAMRRQAS